MTPLVAIFPDIRALSWGEEGWGVEGRLCGPSICRQTTATCCSQRLTVYGKAGTMSSLERKANHYGAVVEHSVKVWISRLIIRCPIQLHGQKVPLCGRFAAIKVVPSLPILFHYNLLYNTKYMAGPFLASNTTKQMWQSWPMLQHWKCEGGCLVNWFSKFLKWYLLMSSEVSTHSHGTGE